jgi:cytoskeletal protein RodZ
MVYVLGYIRSYARLLELDGDALVSQYKEQAGSAPSRTELQFRVPDAEARGVPGGAAMLIGVVVAAFGYGSWYYLSTNDRSIADLVPSLPERLGGPGNSVVATPIVRNPEPVAVSSGVSATADLPLIPPVPASARPAVAPAGSLTTGASETRGTQRTTLAGASREMAEQPQDAVPDNPATADMSPGSGPNAAVSLANANAPAPPARRDPTAAVAAMPAPAAGASADAATGSSAGPRTVAGAPTRVAIRAVQESWLQIKDAAGNVVATKMLQPGDVLNVPDLPGVRMTTGNAGGLQIMVDGAQSPWMGRSGEVVRNVSLEPPNLMRGRNLGN